MNGAELLLRTAAQAGIKVCFANAGTTEMPLVMALDSVPGIRPVLGLFEGVCTGAADGFGRMSDMPAMALLHLGPGFANGIANLHNARKAGTPILAVVGEHATWHRAADAPLAMDIEGLAATVSGWYRTTKSPASLSSDMAEAVGACRRGQIATLIVPSDHQWAECSETEIVSRVSSFLSFDSKGIDETVQVLKGYRKTGLILGGTALGEKGLRTAARIKAVVGCDLLANTFPSYVERGDGLPDVARVPYFPDPAIELLSRYEAIVLVGAREPVTFFGYRGFPGLLLTEQQRKVSLTADGRNAAEALERLADALHAPATPHSRVNVSDARPAMPQGELTPEKACLVVTALQPEGAIVVDEGITSSFSYYPLGANLPRHTVLTIAGGSIGYGMPCALGAALARPDRPVINIQADGSAMYTVQALWTQAHEALNVTTLICSNRSYNILRVELARVGITTTGPNVSALIDIDHPAISWVKVAEGLGVPAVSVNTAEELARELRRALSEPGPHLIEMMLM